MRSFFVYMLECSDGSLYTGYTADVARRLARHRSGRGSKYVASRLPFTLAYLEEAPSLRRAMAREHEIKQMKRGAKLSLCLSHAGRASPWPPPPGRGSDR